MIPNSTPTLDLDYTKIPEQLVVDIINRDNGTSLKTDQLTFGKPELTLTGRYNSKVKATAVVKKGLKGSTVIHYNRIDIGEIPDGRSTLFKISSERTISDLIPAIDAAYKLKLTPNDYVDAQLPPNFDSIYPVDLVAAEQSLIFVNKLTFSVERPHIYLSDIITNVILRGLTYVKPLNPLQLILA